MRRLRLLGSEWYLSAALNEAGNEAGSLTLRISDGQASFTATLTPDNLNRGRNDAGDFAKRVLKGLTQPDGTDELVLETEPPILKWQARIPTAIPRMTATMTQEVPLEREHPRGGVLHGMLLESAEAIACAERDAFAEERRGARLRAELCAIDKIKQELDKGFAESSLEETMKKGLFALNTIKRQIAARYVDETDNEEASSGDEVQSMADSEATLIDNREPVGDLADRTTQRPAAASTHVRGIGSAYEGPNGSTPVAVVSQPPQDVMDLF